jgi:hypothetical protein
MRLANTNPPNQLSAPERRAELCELLARGLIRLRMGDQVSDRNGESCLHYLGDQCLHATELDRRDA